MPKQIEQRMGQAEQAKSNQGNTGNSGRHLPIEALDAQSPHRLLNLRQGWSRLQPLLPQCLGDRPAEAAGETASERVIPGAPDTSFRREWLHFADCILAGVKPRTPLSGGLADLDLAVRIIQAMPPKRL
ncbi:hypothetical protein NKH52_20135 [Mesorhizobium sp. M1066]|uniref:hypothetical protein n=1 Tax=unclassified Mesorhizobium TaxID=325217 RepID=UPI00333C23C1